MPSPIVLIVGPNIALREKAVAAIVNEIPEDLRSMSIEKFDGGPMARALDSARTPSLLGGQRVVIIDQPDGLMSADEGAREALLAYAEKAPAHATLVLICDKLDGRLKIVKSLAKAGETIKCEAPKERDMPRFIAEQAAERGVKLQPLAAHAVAEAVGTDAALAMREVEKLALVWSERSTKAPMSVAEVEPLLRPGKSVGAFALEDAILAGRRDDALEMLERHIAGGSTAPLALLGRLASIARKLSVAADVVERGGGEGDVREALSCHPFVAKKYAGAARSRGPACARAQAACVAADLMLKSGRDPRAALTRVVMSF